MIINFVFDTDFYCFFQLILNYFVLELFIFVLNCIIDKVVMYEKSKLYCCFVDFKKAFDVVYRNGIFIKMIRNGCSSKVLNILQSMYASVKTCVRSNGNLSDFFDSFFRCKTRWDAITITVFAFYKRHRIGNLVWGAILGIILYAKDVWGAHQVTLDSAKRAIDAGDEFIVDVSVQLKE